MRFTICAYSIIRVLCGLAFAVDRNQVENTIQKSVAERTRLEDQIRRLESMLENESRQRQQMGERAASFETKAAENENVIQKLAAEIELAKDTIAQLNKRYGPIRPDRPTSVRHSKMFYFSFLCIYLLNWTVQLIGTKQLVTGCANRIEELEGQLEEIVRLHEDSSSLFAENLLEAGASPAATESAQHPPHKRSHSADVAVGSSGPYVVAVSSHMRQRRAMEQQRERQRQLIQEVELQKARQEGLERQMEAERAAGERARAEQRAQLEERERAQEAAAEREREREAERLQLIQSSHRDQFAQVTKILKTVESLTQTNNQRYSLYDKILKLKKEVAKPACTLSDLTSTELFENFALLRILLAVS